MGGGPGCRPGCAAACAEPRATFVRGERKVGRNEPCPCGSGKKYKHCHGALSKRRVAADRRPYILVVAAALYDARGRVLIAQRPPGKHMAGRWEFPGGKVGAGESEARRPGARAAEELGVRSSGAARCCA